MQKHNESDEVFILLNGDFTLFLGGQGSEIGKIEAIKLEPLKLYNVKKGTFHTHIPEKTVLFLLLKIGIPAMIIRQRSNLPKNRKKLLKLFTGFKLIL